MLKAELEKRLKEFTLKLTLTVKRGEYLTLLGRSGAGKSTAAKLIAGILKPDRGRIYLNGREITDLPPEKRGISYLPQGECLFPHMSVKENLEFPFKVRGVRTPSEKIGEVALKFGISGILEQSPRRISGGEARRVALARALLSEPQVVILDEPLSSLDFATKVEVIELLKELKGKVSVLHITHDPLEAKELSDRVLYIEKGELLFNGSWEEFLGSRWELPEKIREYLSP